MEQKKVWFKAKTYGWGWTPCVWQGWVVLIIFVVGLISEGVSFSTLVGAGIVAPWSFLLRVVVLVTLFLIICYSNGEKPRWRWGKEKSEVDEIADSK